MVPSTLRCCANMTPSQLLRWHSCSRCSLGSSFPFNGASGLTYFANSLGVSMWRSWTQRPGVRRSRFILTVASWNVDDLVLWPFVAKCTVNSLFTSTKHAITHKTCHHTQLKWPVTQGELYHHYARGAILVYNTLYNRSRWGHLSQTVWWHKSFRNFEMFAHAFTFSLVSVYE
jgi:hypothetical protein